MPQKRPIHPILNEIEAYCLNRGIGFAAFGDRAINDPSLVASIRRGRSPNYWLCEEIRRFMLTGVSLREPRQKKAS